jgi:hypothetical protein
VSERLLSYSEVSRAMTCQAQWDFSYGGHLAGSALKAKRTAPLLSGGRAWGAAFAAYHACLGIEGVNAGQAAREALADSLEDDADRQREFGVHDQAEHDKLYDHLLGVLMHYIYSSEAWVADRIVEHELLVPIPSRTGVRASNRYKLLAYIDATRQRDGRPWLVECKLRKQLTSVEFIQLSRQLRIYAWAWWQQTGIKPAGVEVHERLNEVPKAPRMVLAPGQKGPDGKRIPSHAKDQMCTADAYEELCGEFGIDPKPETVEALRTRKWHQVVPIIFRDGELEEAGRELTSGGKLIQMLDSGELFPVRNSKPQNCRGCAFREICPAPDPALVDALFERTPAKRDRSEEEMRA